MEQQQSLFDEIRRRVDARIDAKPVKVTPSVEWPIWAKTLKAMAKPEDKGIGDVVYRMIGDEKSEAFEAWHLATFGKPCDCTARRERWNRLYPLP